MRPPPKAVHQLVLLVLLLAMLYPALVLDCRVSPEASLRSAKPWRLQWGPYPGAAPATLAAATQLGPRLARISNGTLADAIWNPYIGGGRPGWLSSAEEGGAPLVVIAGLAARQSWAWTALFGLQIAAAFITACWLLRSLGLGVWSASIGAVLYALSGPVACHWFDWQGSAMALGPLVLMPALKVASTTLRQLAGWTVSIAVVWACGSPALPFVALALLLVFWQTEKKLWIKSGLIVTGGVALATLLLFPRLWLVSNGTEVGATRPFVRAWAPLSGVHSLLSRDGTTPDMALDDAVPAEGFTDRQGYLGIISLTLAILGGVVCSKRDKLIWLPVAAFCLLQAFLSNSILAKFGLHQRALGVLALCVAVLAAFAVEFLLSKTSSAISPFFALAVGAVLIFDLLPVASLRVPFVRQEEATLPPLLTVEDFVAGRYVGLLGTLPPDTGASFGIADVRANSFPGEPAYARIFDPGVSGTLSITRTFSPRVADLGGRFILEPVSLRVVSGRIYSSIEVVDSLTTALPSADELFRFALHAPKGASRLGIVSSTGVINVWLERPGRRSQLDVDTTLVGESDDWRWFAVPKEWGNAPLTVALQAQVLSRDAIKPTFAWDSSGLRLKSESGGVREWEWEQAKPFAMLVPHARSDGALATKNLKTTFLLKSEVVSSTFVRVTVDSPSPALLVTQLKFRPNLWHARINGKNVAIVRANEIWSGVSIPAGSAVVEFTADLPKVVWLTPLVTIAFLVVMFIFRSRQ